MEFFQFALENGDVRGRECIGRDIVLLRNPDPAASVPASRPFETGRSLNRHTQDLGRRLYHLLLGGALTVGLLLARLGGMFQK